MGLHTNNKIDVEVQHIAHRLVELIENSRQTNGCVLDLYKNYPSSVMQTVTQAISNNYGINY